MYRDDVVFSTKLGDIDGDLKCEKLTLVGVQAEKDSEFMDNLKLVIENYKNEKQTFNIDISGYAFNLSLANFFKDSTNQIFITGQYGGSAALAVFKLYQYKNNKLKLILDDTTLANQLNYTARFLTGGLAEFIPAKGNKKFTIDISRRYKDHLDLIYDKEGNVLPNVAPSISNANTAYPILQTFNNYYTLQLQQRIIGLSNSDTLGYIQSIIDVNENGKIDIIRQDILLFGTDMS
jgi:hypothetical protein